MGRRRASRCLCLCRRRPGLCCCVGVARCWPLPKAGKGLGLTVQRRHARICQRSSRHLGHRCQHVAAACPPRIPVPCRIACAAHAGLALEVAATVVATAAASTALAPRGLATRG